VALRLIKPGNTNQQVTAALAAVARAYDVNAVQGTLMHQMKRSVDIFSLSFRVLRAGHAPCTR
jgi:hypothetical protein